MVWVNFLQSQIVTSLKKVREGDPIEKLFGRSLAMNAKKRDVAPKGSSASQMLGSCRIKRGE